jgi:hypothetical protein
MPEHRAKRKLVVVAQLTTPLLVALLTATLFAFSTAAQVRGVASARAPHAGISFRHSGRARLVGPARDRHSNGYIFYPFYDSDYDYHDSDYEPVEPPDKAVHAQPEEESVPIAHPAESVILENRNGQWVRIPTGTQWPISPPAEFSGPRDAASRSPIKLPRTVLVFRDGHQEEVERYVIQGTDLYTSADYWNSGTWTRRIPIAELDVPASVKLNAARGGNFSLPTRSYEIIVRF